MRIGIIQSRAEAGDFSGNLRRIVQGYRSCLDLGAEFVVASAQALDGSFVGGLRERSSFLLQAQAALKALAEEVRLPLLLGSYASAPHQAAPSPTPFLIHGGEVHRLANRSVVQIGEHRVFADVGGESPLPPPAGVCCDAVLHLPQTAWHVDCTREWKTITTREANETQCAALIVQGLGCSAGRLHAGGSLYALPGGEPRMLPLFEAAECILPTQGAPHAEPPCTALSAIIFCLRETLEQGNYQGLAVAAEEPRGPLLLALAREAVGAERTVGLAWEPSPACASLGQQILLPPPPHTQKPGLLRRFKAQILADCAEEHKLLLLSTEGLRETLLGTPLLPADACGSLAPLGDMEDSRILRVQQELNARSGGKLELPPLPCMPPEEEQELLMLAVEGRSPFEMLLGHNSTDETRLRRLLRQLNHAANQAPPAPRVLQLRRHRCTLPPHHKLIE